MKYLPKNHFDLKARGLDKFHANVTDIWSNAGFESKFFVENKSQYEELISSLEAQKDWEFSVEFVTKNAKVGYRVEITIRIKPTID